MKSKFKYTIFIIVFTLICLEIFGRIYLSVILKKSSNPKFQFDSYRIYSHVPGFKEGSEGKNWIEINDQGFRRKLEVKKEKKENTIRVFLLGGSAAHGISSAAPYPVRHIYPEETIDYYLEKRLKEKYPSLTIEVINAAVTGYQVFQHTSYIANELIAYDPDVIIFMDGANDHYIHNPNYTYQQSNPYQFWTNRLQNPSFGGLVDYIMLWTSKYSGFARGYFSWRLIEDAKSKSLEIKPYQHINDSSMLACHNRIASYGYLQSVQNNLDILNRYKVNSIVCLQPMLVLRDTTFLSDAEKKFLHQDKPCQLLYPQVVRQLQATTAHYKTPFIDLNPGFNNQKHKGEGLFIDYCHLSPLGGNVIAEAIFPTLDSLVNAKLKITFKL